MEELLANPSHDGAVTRQVSRGMVGLFKKYAGRGPRYARTYVNQDVLVTVLHDTLTQAERTLVRMGELESVRYQRRVLQRAFRDEAIAFVEQATGRVVIARLSDHDIATDHAVETFVLEPGAPGRPG